ncbi:MAG TPA: bifunctional phosphoribosyl-AMP cyclohydrolase/phosphoribosyl-ATP diphosphatase HisIE [Desulfitobacterium dehalogenans]|uniref:Histidine biosynthesis bifunctional protein HisIE n=1 Tax=Desulfitobacterium dehalogenans TaxID=36854 RepID=A0A7C6Z2Y7_9FIRM|nr:bifunctional phosphoribosyl-AMP cyclohydrolase/phosphoribosyl-ATP diphosphatase HisIE [Desulfitobacterium dehalogenans]
MNTHNPKESQAQVPQGIRWNAEGLIPAIVQDVDTKEVLMLAYMNEEALRLTLQEGRAWYFSRSRQSLWLKGESSGNTQEVMDLRFDCDRDTILLMVKQKGVACHEDFYSCFHYGIQGGDYVTLGRPKEAPLISLGRTMELLAEVIHSRNIERPEGAYTTYLFDKGLDKILKKIGEESAETIIAAKNSSAEEIRYEVSDLIYHVLVMLEERGVSLKDIAQELLSRRK